MQETLFIFLILVILCATAASLIWAASDAKRRGKPAFLVCVLILCSFPLGLCLWLLFRREIQTAQMPPWLPGRTPTHDPSHSA